MQQLGVHQLKEVHTRFLLPLFFDQWSIDQAAERLKAHRYSRATDDSKPQVTWECDPSSGLYQDEVLDHVNRFLFRSDSSTCRYLKVTGNVLNAIFHHHVTLKLRSGSELRVKPSKAGIELFLMNQGVGLLSIALMPDGQSQTQDDVIEFNYLMARHGPLPAAELSIPHPLADPTKRISPTEAARIPKAPDRDAPRLERLGAPGGVFTLEDLVNELLIDPLRDFNCRKIQQGWSVYTVARFSDATDFGDVQTRTGLTRFLSALAQVEEPGHAGAVPGSSHLTNEVFNTKHWGAVGLLGAVHLVADQAPSARDTGGVHPFNDQRVPRVRDKYFIPFLMASLQKLFLERTIREASAFMEFSTGPRRRSLMKEVRTDIEEVLGNASARVFEESGDYEDFAFQLFLNGALIEAADTVVGKHRLGNNHGNQPGEARDPEDEDRDQLLSFLREDLRRAIGDMTETVFQQAGKINRQRLRKRCDAALAEAIDGIFAQHKHLARQLEDVLQFAVQGHFVQVSSRQVLHRFYRLAQEGLDVPEAWKEVNFAISNLDRKLAAQREHEMAKTMARNLIEIGRVQRAVHILEFIIIAVYGAEVFHIFTTKEHLEIPWLYHPLGVTLALALGFLLALTLNYVIARRKDD